MLFTATKAPNRLVRFSTTTEVSFSIISVSFSGHCSDRSRLLTRRGLQWLRRQLGWSRKRRWPHPASHAIPATAEQRRPQKRGRGRPRSEERRVGKEGRFRWS